MPATLDAELFDAERFDAALAAGDSPLPLFREALRHANEVLIDRFHQGRAATELVHARATLIDALLQRAWRLHLPEDSPDIALVAVGGYGRGELHPASDIDLLILLRDTDEPWQDGISAFLTFLWDIGLEVGQSVRNVQECVTEATRDITVATNIQESRLLLGARELYDEQRRLCSPEHIWPGPAFFTAKWEEQIERHARYQDTGYNLEPNIKESPGGLRDIQMIGWVAKRHFGADTLAELVDHGFLTADEYRILHEGQAFLWRVRFGLHVLARRREDRLLFDYQRELARQFGYRDTPQRLAVEQFMKQYYRTVMELSRLNEMLLQLFQEEILYTDQSEEPVPINRRFQARRGFLEVTHENVFRRYPFALLEVFLLLEQHPELKGVRANTIRLIRRERELIDPDFRADLRNRSLFMEIMRQTEGVTHELRRMNRYGILAAYLPEFGKIVGQMQHDLFHVYTVDEHTLMVIRNLRRLTVPEFRHEFPFCSELIQTIPKQELLLIAALYHDIAKGRGGDHAELGAVDAEAFCRRHGLSEYDTRLVTWLVRNHLLMSSVAQRQDISDPDTVHAFAEKVGEKNRLDYLYLLTIADIRGTSDKVWNDWKGALLKQLYDATRDTFRRGLENPVLQSERIRETRRLAGERLAADGFDIQRAEHLWQQLGDEYLLRFQPEEIAWQTAAILSHGRSGDPLVLVRDAPRGGGSDVFIYMPSRPNLFLHATRVMERAGASIMDARVFDANDNHALDAFRVVDADGRPLGSERGHELQQRLFAVLGDPEAKIPAPSTTLPRQVRHFAFPPEVTFETDEAHGRTLMHVRAIDRPGLLSRIAQALQDCNVQLRNARIATFGEKAEDMFYIVDRQDRPVADPQIQDCLRERIAEYLGG